MRKPTIDLTGQIINNIKIIKQVPKPEDKRTKGAYWECICPYCNNIFITTGRFLRSNQTKSCGCLSKKNLEKGQKLKNYKDLTNQRFNKLIALYPIESEHAHKMWHCKCDCGNECDVESSRLIAGITKSCGCLKLEAAINNIKSYSGKNKKYIIGQKFDMLTVIEELPERKNGRIMYKCLCDCGNYTTVSSHHLLQGQIGSCGCRISKGEWKIQNILKENNILFEKQKTFKNLLSAKNFSIRFDFYLPNYNCCIEFQGEQHYNETSRFYSEVGQDNDNRKRAYCKNNNIKLIEIPYWDYNKLNWNYLEELLNENRDT